MKLFTKDIDKKLFAQYLKGNNLEEQNVVSKVFNPYGKGRWYFLNSDPEDPDYLWAIVQMGDVVEIGSVSRKELESIRVSPFRFPLERDLSFRPTNAYELWKGLKEGKHYKDGGWVDADENKHMVLNRAEGLEHHADELEEAAKKADHVPAWVVAKVERASSDIADSTHYLDGENEIKREEEEGEEEYAQGGELKWQDAELGDSALVVSENKMGIIIKPYGRKFHLKFVDGTEKTYDASELKFFGDIDDFDRGGKIKSGKKIKYQGKEGRIISKKGDMYFVEIENYNPNGDSLHIVLREGEFEKMAEGGEIKKGDYVIVDNPNWKASMGVDKPVRRKVTMVDDENVFFADGSNSSLKYVKKMAEGGETEEGVDLFEDYENIPPNVQKILDKYSNAFEDGDYKGLEKANKELGKIGYTFEYGLDGQAYDLRKVGKKGKSDVMAKGGEVKFKDKVESIKKSLLKRKKVPKAVQKDYGKTFSPKEAEDSAKRIVGAQTARERLMMRMGKKKKK